MFLLLSLAGGGMACGAGNSEESAAVARPHPLAAAVPSVTSDTLFQALQTAGEHLLRQQRTDGSFPRHYDSWAQVFLGDSKRDHRLQAAACGSLYRLFLVTKDPRFERAGDRCLSLLLGGARGPRPEHQDENFEVITDGAHRSRGDLGATALTLLALVEKAAVREDVSELPRMRRQARFLLFQQSRVGEPTYHYSYGAGKTGAFESPSAPAQAALALVRLSRIDGDNEELWRQGGERFVGWIMAVRDLGKTYDRLPHDPWLQEALAELYEVSGGGRTYFLHGRRVAAGILHELEARKGSPSLQGHSFQSTALGIAARRCEVLALMVRMAQEGGENADPYSEALERTTSQLLRLQQDTPQSLLGEPSDGIRNGDGAPGRGDVTMGTILHTLGAWSKLWRLKSRESAPLSSGSPQPGKMVDL